MRHFFTEHQESVFVVGTILFMHVTAFAIVWALSGK